MVLTSLTGILASFRTRQSGLLRLEREEHNLFKVLPQKKNSNFQTAAHVQFEHSKEHQEKDTLMTFNTNAEETMSL